MATRGARASRAASATHPGYHDYVPVYAKGVQGLEGSAVFGVLWADRLVFIQHILDFGLKC